MREWVKEHGYTKSDAIWAAILFATGFALLVVLDESANGPVILAISAIAIAVFVYPWQKSVDRSLETEREKRAAIMEYIRALHSCDILFLDEAPADKVLYETLIACVTSRSRLGLYRDCADLDSEFVSGYRNMTSFIMCSNALAQFFKQFGAGKNLLREDPEYEELIDKKSKAYSASNKSRSIEMKYLSYKLTGRNIDLSMFDTSLTTPAPNNSPNDNLDTAS